MSGIFTHLGTVWASQAAGLSGLRDLVLIAGPEGPVTLALSGPAPGFQLTARQPGESVHFDAAGLIGAGQAGIAPRMFEARLPDGSPVVLITGSGHSGLAGFRIDAAGGPGAPLPAASGLPVTLSHVAQMQMGDQSLLYGIVPGSQTPMLWLMLDGGALQLRHPGSTATGQGGLPAPGLTDLVAVGDYLVAGGTGDLVLSLYRLASDGTLLRWDSIRGAENPGISGSVVLEKVHIDGEDYIIVGAAGSGTLTVYRVVDPGRLELTDHVIDSRFSRFDGVSDLAVVEDGNSVYIAAGGWDQGISLFRLLPGGRLLHEGVQEDGLETALDGLAGMDLALDEAGDLVLVTAGLRDGGISTFRLETAPQGLILNADDSGARLEGGTRADLLSGGAGDDSLLGDGGADVLRDGAGADWLEGGNGADVFVFDTDGQPDVIADFEPGRDRIDLSGWAFWRGPDQLLIETTVDGAEVIFDGPAGREVIRIHADNGQPLTEAQLRAALITGPDRFLPDWLDAPALRPPDGPDPEALNLRGTARNDRLSGGDAGDTVQGNAGSDRLSGGMGDDLLVGGIGFDTLYGGAGDDLLRALDGYDSLEGGSGHDMAYGNNGFDTLKGGDGDDSLYGGLSPDTLEGGDGQDHLQGDAGSDLLEGQGGDDLLRGNAGTDLLRGGLGADTLEGGINHDTLEGGAGDDLLMAGNGFDMLDGGSGNDTLFGQAGNDRLEGGGGWDVLNGGLGADSFVFRGGGTTVVQDFQDGLDSLLLDPSLWGGGARTAAQVLEAFARIEAGNTVLDFGAMGEMVLLGLEDPQALLDDITLL